MFKTIKLAVLSFVLTSFIIPSFVSAQVAVPADVDTSGNTSSCVTIGNNLSYKKRSTYAQKVNFRDDVVALQDFLNTEISPFSGTVYLSDASNYSSGFFDKPTNEAVINFQKDNGLVAVPPGYVGPGTRARIHDISCNGAPSSISGNVGPYYNLPTASSPTPSFSSITGQSCLPTPTTFLPAGCSSTCGFSPLTGQACGSTGNMNQNGVNVLDNSSATYTWNANTGSSGKLMIDISNLPASNTSIDSYSVSIECRGISLPRNGIELCGTTQRLSNLHYSQASFEQVYQGKTSDVSVVLTLRAERYNGDVLGKKQLFISDYSNQLPNISSVPTVEFIGTPTLDLTYDGTGHESFLIGRATLKVTTGGNSVTSVCSPLLQLMNVSTGLRYWTNSAKTNPQTFSVRSNSAKNIELNIAVPAKELFSGSYVLVPSDFCYSSNGVDNVGLNISTSSFINARQSNAKTVIGETSPYITSVGCDSTPGINCTITGSRFNPSGNMVNISGVTKSLPAFGNNNSSINFTMYDFGFTQGGNYNVQVSTNNGTSNYYSFTSGNVVGPNASQVDSKIVGLPVINQNRFFHMYSGADTNSRTMLQDQYMFVSLTTQNATSVDYSCRGTNGDIKADSHPLQLPLASTGIPWTILNTKGWSGTYNCKWRAMSPSGTTVYDEPEFTIVPATVNTIQNTNQSAMQALPPTIVVSRIPSVGTPGTSYTVNWNATSATKVNWSCTAGPNGGYSGSGYFPQKINSIDYGVSGSISGTYTADMTGSSNCTWTATNGSGALASTNESFTVNPAPASVPLPTATLLINGVKDSTIPAGTTHVKEWHSTGGTSWSSTYSFDNAPGATCSHSLPDQGSWNASSADGSVTNSASSNNVGCKATITYTVSNSAGSVSAVATQTTTATVASGPVFSLTRITNADQSQTVSWTSSPDITKLDFICYGSNGDIKTGNNLPLQQPAVTNSWDFLTQNGWKGKYTCTYTATGGPMNQNANTTKDFYDSFEIKATKVLGDYISNVPCTNLPYNVHRGYEDNNVKNLQSFLAKKGLLSDTPTGFYGDKTVEAVKDYQASKGLPVTGMVFDFTRSAIKSETCK